MAERCTTGPGGTGPVGTGPVRTGPVGIGAVDIGAVDIGPVDVERHSVRVVLLDRAGRVLLFDTHDPTMPETGSWWELPGGGREPGEDVVATALREVAEETGFRLDPDRLSVAHWRRSTTYLRRHVRTLQHEVVLAARLDADAPEPAVEGRTPQERVEYVGHRWWQPVDIASSAERFFPGRLPELLPRFLAGEEIDEPFDRWN